jgi:hypothetical protein
MSNAEMQREPAVAGTIDMKLEVDCSAAMESS